MASKKILRSIYLDPETIEALDARSTLEGETKADLIRRYIEAGLQQPARTAHDAVMKSPKTERLASLVDQLSIRLKELTHEIAILRAENHRESSHRPQSIQSSTNNLTGMIESAAAKNEHELLIDTTNTEPLEELSDHGSGPSNQDSIHIEKHSADAERPQVEIERRSSISWLENPLRRLSLSS
ncbi:MAG: ribbon-helix-helix protein, CopG family [Myxococcota bacterium]